jgi:nucleotide-binding universal stress UspA family protein
MFQKILVAIDDSESSRNIFERSLTLATANRSELMLIHVLTILDDFYPSDTFIGLPESAMRIYAEQLEKREQAGIEKLQSLAAEATAAGVTTKFTQKIGDPGKMICEVAKAWNANLIVIGRRGLSGLSELLSGSTSNYVFHHAPCDVFTVQGIARTLPQPEPPTILAGST